MDFNYLPLTAEEQQEYEQICSVLNDLTEKVLSKQLKTEKDYEDFFESYCRITDARKKLTTRFAIKYRIDPERVLGICIGRLCYRSQNSSHDSSLSDIENHIREDFGDTSNGYDSVEMETVLK